MRKIRILESLILILCLTTLSSGCSINSKKSINQEVAQNGTADGSIAYQDSEENEMVTPKDSITKLEDNFSTVQFTGDDGFDSFLEKGGAVSDSGVVSYLSSFLMSDLSDINLSDDAFGCSTIAVKDANGDALFGRNFDWNYCDAIVVLSKPNSGYSSISTVNMSFIKQGVGALSALLTDNMKKTIALYAPLDGMNEKGLCVSVNMIEDSATINQNTDKPDITTTTAIRLLLNKAANVSEALDLLKSYDMHASFNYMVHFAIADNEGNHVVVEYINNEMVVIDTPVVTNFYIAEGEKEGIGSSQSHTRYETLQNTLTQKGTMTMGDVRDTLNSVSKHNFGEFESTEWSIVFNQTTKEVKYYHRENYNKSYTFKLN